ncbi:Choline transporter-like protein 5 [Pteropus alecto]|uniref:Choline transporter-like protein n=1 Tax=Pteropus alecto TaxID=9402 RepID=L5K644_PTEAL|nr:Choline transporter-like protein 5 [Pteropus alecto]
MEAEIRLDYEGIEAAGRDYYVSAAREEQEKDREDTEGISYIIDATEMAIVLQRCFPDFSYINGTLTVGNKTMFEDGKGRTRNAAELRTAAKSINKILDAKAIGVKVFEDYATTWYWILIGLTIAMLLSWIFLILLRFTAGFLFWVFMLGVIGIIGYGIWYCYREYSNLQGHQTSHLTIYDIGIQSDISTYFQLRQTWFIFMIILSILEVFIILMLIFLRNRIRISIALLKEGSNYLATSGVPIYKIIAPDGQCKHENKTCDPEIFNTTEISRACPGAQCIFSFYGGKTLYHQYINTLQMFNLFVFLWLINFVIALGQCALAGAFASYYWALKKPEDIPPYPLFTAFGRAIRYHTGSLAFGSLILALIQMIRIILEYLDKRFKGILAFLLFTQRIPMILEGPTSLNYYWVPLLTVVIGSYLIAHGFFSVYAMCIDTLFICFCEDLERNDGSTEKPYFIAPTLHGILNKKQLVPQKQKE